MNNKQWRQETIKSVRISPELAEMVAHEIEVRKMSFSSYARLAMMLAMKYRNGTGQEFVKQNQA